MVHKTNSATVTLTIPVGDGPQGIAVNPITSMVYVANRDDGTVSLIDGKTNSVTATIPVGAGPQGGIAVNPSTNKAYIVDTLSTPGIVTVIDGKTNSVTATIPVGAGPQGGIAVNPSTNMIYVTNELNNTVSVIVGKTNTVTATIRVGHGPIGIAVNPLTDIAYVANSGLPGHGHQIDGNTVSVIDGKTNTVRATIRVGTLPQFISINPSTNAAYVANGNSVSVINGKTNTLTATIPGYSLVGIAVNPSTHKVYFGGKTVSVLDDKTNTVTTTIPMGKSAAGIAVNPSTGIAYVTNYNEKTISVIYGSKNEPLRLPSSSTITPSHS